MTRKKTQFIYNLSLLILLFSFSLFIGLERQNIDLNNADKITGIVENRGIDLKYGSKGIPSDVFYIKLKGVDKKLGVYRISKNYDALFQKINVGDTLTLYYYDNDNQRENVNIDLIQVERDNVILIHQSEYENKESIGIYVGIGGLIGTVLFFIYNRKKIL